MPDNEHTPPPGGFRDPAVEIPGGDPYEQFAEFGVTFDSSMADIHRAALSAQRARRLTPERNEAWRILRNPERRLITDFFYCQIDPALFGVAAAADSTEEFWNLLAETLRFETHALPPIPVPEPFVEENDI